MPVTYSVLMTKREGADSKAELMLMGVNSERGPFAGDQ
jgi:hypothetical protein